MARRLRIEYPGALYHVIVRGNNREEVFQDDNDKQKYLNIIEKYKEKLGFKLYAYALLPNHTHSLMEVAEEPLSRIMQRIQQVYTQYYNWKYERTGHVFQQRYNAKLCLKDDYVLTLINYIHYNPVKAGLSPNLNYRWSSHLDYLHPNKKSIVDTGFPLSYFGTTQEISIKNYAKFMGDIITEELTYPSLDIGMDYEITERRDYRNKKKYLETEAGKTGQKHELNQGGISDSALSLQELQTIVAREMGISEKVMSKKSRLTEVVLARKYFIYLAKEYTKTNNSMLARFLGLSNSAITKALNEMDEETKEEVLLMVKRNRK